jgi:glucosyl-dolichyl phosphate glucuronosyltransferase
MTATVIICTYNRCETLKKALQSISVSILPPSVEWEVLVIDNNSNDQTRAVVEDFCRQVPQRFRYLFEPHPGKSYALNAGIAAARGDVLAFTDDDVIVEPTWLANLAAPLCDKTCAGAAGKTLPITSFSTPKWLSDDAYSQWGGVLGGLFDMGNDPFDLTTAPYGVNMAFRKGMFENYGMFRVDLGPSPTSEIRNEDTEFGQRLLAAGERLRYVPSAVVYHEISCNRLQKKYFLKWWYDFGRARIRENGVRPKIFGVPRPYISIPNNILRVLPVETLRWFLASDQPKRFYYKCRVWATAGRIEEIWRHLIANRAAS